MITKIPYVYIDKDKNKIYWQKRFGRNPMTLKDYKPKRYKNQDGRPFESVEEARLDLMQFELDYCQKHHIYDSKKTYSQFINETYLPHRKETVKSNTFKNEEFIINKLVERFGSKPLTIINELDVHSFKTYLLSEYSQGYAHRIFSKFKHTMKLATKLKLVKYDVTADESIPRPERNFQTWNSEEVHSFLDSLDITIPRQHLLHTLIRFYFYTGVRPNEALALFWENLDFNKKEISVKQTLIIEPGIPIYRQNHTKTKAGMRILTLDDRTIDILINWKKKQTELGIKSPYIFSLNGKARNISTISKYFKTSIEKTNCKTITIQELRHSHATFLMFEKQCTNAQLAYRLGHKNIKTVFEYYVKPSPETELDVVKAINEENRSEK